MAAVLAGGVTFFVFRRLRAGLAQRALTQIVASTTDLPAGVALAAKDITLIDWPSDVPLPGSFNKTDAVVGHPLLRSLVARQPILQHDLGIEGSGIGLSTKIPPGMRATAVRSNEIVGVAGFLYPGSRVDVLATYTLPGNNGVLTQTVLQDVEVLTAGQTIEPDPQGKPQEVNVVTLLLSPDNSQKLQLASTQGTIQFVLRNGTDKDTVTLHPTRVDELAGIVKPVEPAKKPAKRIVVAAAPKATYVLEVIQGTKKTVHTFDEENQEQGTK
ncbi:MAG TPA: Flp pilus assembly protein CpaB [Terriglobales bacterium]|jgi:pilus assembly protein CpaB|nr:Flp pilus assembly protein CpaB [Terriglobales bacterium]